MIRKSIYIPIYNQIVVVYIANTMDEVMQKVASDYNVEMDFHSATVGFYKVIENKSKGLEHVIIGLCHDSKNKTIAHECLHASYYMLETIGQDCPQNNHEVLAYLMAYLIEEIDKIRVKYAKH